jgi:hypothetical protein
MVKGARRVRIWRGSGGGEERWRPDAILKAGNCLVHDRLARAELKGSPRPGDIRGQWRSTWGLIGGRQGLEVADQRIRRVAVRFIEAPLTLECP